jgi:hypothetical protein
MSAVVKADDDERGRATVPSLHPNVLTERTLIE